MKTRLGTWLSNAMIALAITSVSPALARQPDIAAAEKQFDALDAARDYACALVEGQKLEAAVKARVGASHRDYARVLSKLAGVYASLGKYAEAADLYQRALAIREKVLGPSHPDVAKSLNNLAFVYHSQGKYAEAAELHQRALAIREKVLGPDHPDVAESLHDLAIEYRLQGKYAEAAELHQRALAIREKALGPGHPDVATSFNNLAIAYQSQGKYAEAEDLLQRALAIDEKALGPDHRDVAGNLIALANVYKKQGKYAEAADLLQRALAIDEKALGPDHPDVAISLSSLATAYNLQGKYAEAVELYQRARAIQEKALGLNHPDVALSLNELAKVYRSAGKPNLALTFSRRATAAVIAHAATGDTGRQHADNAHGLIEQRAAYFVLHVANLSAAARGGIYPALDMGREGFQIAQWAVQSSASAAVQQMALRFAPGNNALAALVRDNQDLAAAWRGRDKALVAALGKPEGQQDRAATERLRAEMAEAEGKLAANSARLDKEFPDYAALANPRPLSVEKMQKLLGADAALVFILPGDKESYVFALTNNAFDWRTIPLGTSALSEKVSAFRHGLDVGELRDRSMWASRNSSTWVSRRSSMGLCSGQSRRLSRKKSSSSSWLRAHSPRFPSIFS
jgi:tetratricopeptide (TPR) repeat protein